ncbi:MAG: S8 family serine peptidase [bacterium]
MEAATSVNRSRRRRLALTTMAAATCLAFPIASRAQQAVAAPALTALTSARTDLVTDSGPGRKLGPDLLALYLEHRDFQQSHAAGPFRSANTMLDLDENGVVIDAVAAAGEGGRLRTQLAALGMGQVARYRHVVSGRMPVAALLAMADASALRFARPAYHTTNTGSVLSQGDEAMRTDVARPASSVTGAGMVVGTLSNSYNCLGGAPAGVTSGDLPAGVTVLAEAPSCSGQTDEGRGMMELIADVAPGAAQAFNTANGGQAAFAAGILALANTAGADVINDDVIYFAEPMFQDGIIAQAVDEVVAAGVPYFSSAGNQARQAYDAPFRSSGTSPAGLPFGYQNDIGHDFDPGPGVDVYQKVTIPNGTTQIVLQWSSPYASASGGAGATSDLDFWLYLDPPTSPVIGIHTANVGGDPIEIMGISNGGGATLANIAISVHQGSAPALLKYTYFRSSMVVNEYATNTASSYGHANARGARSMGAAFYFQTPPFGTSPAVLESFSSIGGTPTLWDLNDNPINVVRQKPNLVAPDGTNTTFFGGSDISDPGDGSDLDTSPNFFGTSAAAPHAAGLAALVRQKNSSLPPVQVYHLLESTAENMGAAGVDFESGHGLVRGDHAVERAADWLFADGFEEGDVLDWGSSVP